MTYLRLQDRIKQSMSSDNMPVAIFTQTDFPRVVIIIDDGGAPASKSEEIDPALTLR